MTTLGQTFTIAILDDFLDSFARIPRREQRKVNKFLRDFRNNPTSLSRNLNRSRPSMITYGTASSLVLGCRRRT